MTEEMLYWIAGLLSIVGTILGFVISLAKAIKEKNLEKVKNLLQSAAQDAVRYAETVKGVSGETKKMIAMTRMNQAFIQNKVKFDESKASAEIEKVVELTKKVNTVEQCNKGTRGQAAVANNAATENARIAIKLNN